MPLISSDFLYMLDKYIKTNIYFLNYFIVVQLQLSAFPPPPEPNPPPSPASTLPLGFVYVSPIVVPENPPPHCPFPTPFCLL